MMNFDRPLKKFDGTTATIPRGSGQVEATYAIAFAHVLGSTMPGDEALSPLDKLARGALAFKMFNGGDMALTNEEVAVIRAVAAKAFSPEVYYLVNEFLESQLKAKA